MTLLLKKMKWKGSKKKRNNNNNGDRKQKYTKDELVIEPEIMLEVRDRE